jgi:YfiH family protein
MIPMVVQSDPQPTGPFEWTQEPWGRALRCTRLPVPHLFTSRDVMLRRDESEWTAVAASLGVGIDGLRLVKQVHGVAVAVARRGDPPPATRPEADIIITDDPSIAIGVRTADCAAVLLYDAVKNVAGAAHAGWRGTAANAARAAVQAMQTEFGSRPRDLIAAIGPLLGRCCGEVGPDVIDAFRAGGADPSSIDAWFTPGSGDRSLLDLERANVDQLTAAGLVPRNIFASGLCTKTEEARLHSYRAHGPGAGRLLAALRCAVM